MQELANLSDTQQFSFKRTQIDKCFTMIHNNIVYNRELTTSAKGTLLLLLAQNVDDPNFKINLKKIADLSACKIYQTRTDIKLLIKTGYVHYRKTRDKDGTFIHTYYVDQFPTFKDLNNSPDHDPEKPNNQKVYFKFEQDESIYTNGFTPKSVFPHLDETIANTTFQNQDYNDNNDYYPGLVSPDLVTPNYINKTISNKTKTINNKKTTTKNTQSDCIVYKEENSKNSENKNLSDNVLQKASNDNGKKGITSIQNSKSAVVVVLSDDKVRALFDKQYQSFSTRTINALNQALKELGYAYIEKTKRYVDSKNKIQNYEDYLVDALEKAYADNFYRQQEALQAAKEESRNKRYLELKATRQAAHNKQNAEKQEYAEVKNRFDNLTQEQLNILLQRFEADVTPEKAAHFFKNFTQNVILCYYYALLKQKYFASDNHFLIMNELSSVENIQRLMAKRAATRASHSVGYTKVA